MTRPTSSLRRRLSRSALAACLIASAFSFASAARAQDPGADEVTLKNGGTIRGTVIASEPGVSVKILEMGSKEPRVIPWAQVSDVERGKYAPKAPAQPGPSGPGYPGAPVAPPEPQLGMPGVVRLHIDSPVPTKLVQSTGMAVGSVRGYTVTIEQLQPVCDAPCDRVIDGSQGHAFALAGPFPGTKPLSFAGMKGDLNLTVQPGSIGRRVGGVWLTIFGASSVLTGAIMLPLGLSSSVGSTLKYIGIGTLAGGGAMLAAGIALLATSGTSWTLTQGGAVLQTARAKQVKPRYWLGEF